MTLNTTVITMAAIAHLMGWVSILKVPEDHGF
jgi:hypothetical protein